MDFPFSGTCPVRGLRRASRTVGAQPGELRRGDILAFLARLSHIRQAGALVLPLRTYAATADR
jgi:hypothetical protein